MLDTNICISVMKLYPPALLERFNRLPNSSASRPSPLATAD
jgi:hypothetical protein